MADSMRDGAHASLLSEFWVRVSGIPGCQAADSKLTIGQFHEGGDACHPAMWVLGVGAMLYVLGVGIRLSPPFCQSLRQAAGPRVKSPKTCASLDIT